MELTGSLENRGTDQVVKSDLCCLLSSACQPGALLLMSDGEDGRDRRFHN